MKLLFLALSFIAATVYCQGGETHLERLAKPQGSEMTYAIETQNEKFFIGLELRTDNQECSIAMPAHKERFFNENILSKIPNKTTSSIFALYTDYEGDYTKPYSWILGCEVSSLDEIPVGLVGKVIPESKYAVFTTQGEFPEGLIAAWQAIWKSGLSRSYTSDFEIYKPDFDPQANPEVKVYIAIEKETMELETPKHLYKILSLRDWQATQNSHAVALSANDAAFIHFATEDQLDRIIGKYFADAPQFVVLKIDTSQLEGRLVYESNPGGSAKYYHLYEGKIPCTAILESKIIYQEPLECSHVLGITEVGDPVLRQKARPLSEKEILSPEIQDLIESMKATMRAAPGVGVAAPQIGKSIQLIVIEDMDHSHLTAQQILERERSKFPFQVIINPKIYIEGTQTAEFFEGCLSIPEFIGIVPRAKSVRVECLNEKAEPVVIHAKGWYARILQHEIDHLHGILCVDRALLPTVTTPENYVKFWKDKSISEVRDTLIP